MTTEGTSLTVTRPGGVEKYKITKVAGGRYREDFIGIETRGGFAVSQRAAARDDA